MYHSYTLLDECKQLGTWLTGSTVFHSDKKRDKFYAFTFVFLGFFLSFFPPENFWSELPRTFLKTLVELFHTPATKMISVMTYDYIYSYTKEKVMVTFLKKSVQVLQMIYKVNIL